MAVEKVKVLIKNQSNNEAYAEAHYTVNTSNFNAVSNYAGDFVGSKPTIGAIITSPIPISGFTAVFSGMDNYPESCTVTYTFADATTYVDTVTTEGPIVLSELTSSRYCISVNFVINSMNRAYSKLTFQSVHFGHVLEFVPDSIVSLTITQSSDLSGLSAPYHTLDGVFCSPFWSLISTAWQGKPITVSTNVKTIGTYYLQEVDGLGSGLYSVKAVSALGLLAQQSYDGLEIGRGMLTDYVVGVVANNIISIDTSWATGDEIRTYGFILSGGDRREALAAIASGHMRYIDGDGQFRTIDTSSTPINLTTLTIKDTRIYERPKVTTGDSVRTLTIMNYDDSQSTVEYKTYNIEGKTVRVMLADTATFTKTGTVDKTINLYTCTTVEQTGQTHWTNVCNHFKNFYSRRRIWHGKILWNTATSEGKCGTRVTVPCDDGSTITGNVISSVLRFSGVSVSAEIQVLEAGTW